MAEKREPHHRVIAFIAIMLTIWTAIGFFEATYFAAPFYGVTAPSWSDWVGNLSLEDLNLIDTAFLVVFIGGIVLSYLWGAPPRPLRHSNQGGAAGWALLVVSLVLIAAFLGYLGLSLTGVLGHAKGFLGL